MPLQLLDRLLAGLPALPDPPPASAGAGYARRQLAVAVLLLEASRIDRNASTVERDAVIRLLRERFGLTSELAAGMLTVAEEQLDAALEDWVFAHAVRTGFELTEREEVVEMLWEVVYADGELRHLEERTVQRLAEELCVDNEATERARLLAFARVGLGRPTPEWRKPE